MNTILLLDLYDSLKSKFDSETAIKIIQFIECKIETEVERIFQHGKPEDKNNLGENQAKKEETNFRLLWPITWAYFFLNIIFFIIVCLTR